MLWELDSSKPIFRQIVEHIQMEIAAGKYQPGERLQSVRELAVQAAVNPNTMQRAFAELERIGLVYTKRTSGRFITEDENMIKELRQEIAKEKIQMFMESMEQLGFGKNETISLIQQSMHAGQLQEDAN